jgi:predicted nucleic acid-binding protein
VSAYFDSGVLVKNYSFEANSLEATSLIRVESLPLPLTRLQEAEVRNALRLKLFRREVTGLELFEAMQTLDEDIHSARLERVHFSEADLYRRAESLSDQFTMNLGTRTLDILQVAAALEIGSTRFVSFDRRQRALAKQAGLKVLPRP